MALEGLSIAEQWFHPLLWGGCYRVQAHSTHHPIGQSIGQRRCWGKEETWIGEPADWEDVRLVPQNNNLVGAWMPGSFMDQRCGEVIKQSKKIIQFLQISPRKASLRQGDVLVSFPFSPSQVGRVRLSPCEPNKAQGSGRGGPAGLLEADHYVCLSSGSAGKQPDCPCMRHKRHEFDPWVIKIHWRRKWLPTAVFLPGEFHEQRSLVDYSPWACEESDMTWVHEHIHIITKAAK